MADFAERLMVEGAMLEDGAVLGEHRAAALYHDVPTWMDYLAVQWRRAGRERVFAGTGPRLPDALAPFAKHVQERGVELASGARAPQPVVVPGHSGRVFEIDHDFAEHQGEHAEDLQKRLRDAGSSTRFAALVAGAMVEMCDNAREHAASDVRPVGALVVRERSWAFSVTDVGVGVRASLRRNPAFADLDSDCDALREALRPGTSGTATSGRGMGFDAVFRALADQQAVLWFRSGRGAAHWQGRSPTAHQLELTNAAERPGLHLLIRGVI